MKRILMIAAHYPPMKGSSGLQRTLKFSRYLPEFGWLPTVLTVNKRVHTSLSDEQLGEIPRSVEVTSAFALDAKRHLAIAGRYPKFLSYPDRWSSWWLGAVPAGLRLIRRHHIDLIWSTYPIATAHMIGHTLARLSGRPWIADFRDSMTEDEYPADPDIRRAVRAVEQRTVDRASRCVFTAGSAIEMYRARYPEVASDKWVLVSNGYDEENFAQCGRESWIGPRRPVTLIHSGLLDPGDRDPTSFFAAVKALASSGEIDAATVEIRLRASGFDDIYRQRIEEFGIGDIVRLYPPISYRAALAEMMQADGLLLFQAANCNHQIPAKAYEYFRAGRPVLGLTDPAGDTGRLLASVGVREIAALEDAPSVRSAVASFVAAVRAGVAKGVLPHVAQGFARRELTRRLAELCDDAARQSQRHPGAADRA